MPDPDGFRSRIGIEARRALGRFPNVRPVDLARGLLRAATVGHRKVRLHPPPARSERLVVSLTTTPARAGRLGAVLRSLIDQTVQPDRIVLALPTHTRAGIPYPGAATLDLPSGVEILACRDEGPATKLLPVLEAEPRALLVAVDDDVIYPRRFLASLLDEHRRRPDAALGFPGVRLSPGIPFSRLDHTFATGIPEPRRVDVLFGTWGYLVPPGALGPEVHDLSAAPEALRWVDDIWFSGHLARAGVERWVVRADELPIETPNIWRSSLTGGVNASGRNDSIALDYFREDW